MYRGGDFSRNSPFFIVLSVFQKLFFESLGHLGSFCRVHHDWLSFENFRRKRKDASIQLALGKFSEKGD